MNRLKSIPILVLIAGITFSGCGSNSDKQRAENAVEATHHQAAIYTCPMHPSVRSDKPGVCPICHMTLVKITTNESDTSSSQPAEGVALSSSRQVLANILTQAVTSEALVQEISVAGKIDYPEPNAQQITTRFSGRIEQLFASFVGQEIRRGDRIADIYSPDAVAAQQEFLIALGGTEPANSSSEQSTGANADFLAHSRDKLRLLGFTAGQIDTLAKTRAIKTNVTVYSPSSGTIVRKNVDLQGYVAAGDPLFEVADLHTVWLQLDVYEADLSSIHMGEPVTARIDAFPSETFRGVVSFVGAVVEPSTRTVRARATLDNRSLKLKPEMFAQASIQVKLAKSVVVPASAVIATGKRTVVWTTAGHGRFEPREIKLGRRAGELYQVLEGLREGEVIATSGGYLIDSESQLQMAATGHSGH